MPEENQIRIVLASILKPVDDTRMFGKLATTLASVEQYHIHVIGQKSEGQQLDLNIRTHSLPKMNRISVARLVAPWRVLLLVLKLKPALFIITTHELLLIAMACKFFIGCKVIYDVQENYYYNILYTDTFPKLIKPCIAFYIRLKETFTKRFIDHFLLAERAYEKELPFIANKYTVLENKVKKPSQLPDKTQRKKIRKLLFSGTLAPSTGVFTAINIAKDLHQIDGEFTLTIVGFASQKKVCEELVSSIKNVSFITLIGGGQLVPHVKILQAILEADAGIIAYPENPSTKSSTPTKLYEYLGYQLPIIINDESPLKSICEPYDAAVSFRVEAPRSLYELLESHQFYSKLPDFVYWESDQQRLLSTVATHLK